MAGKWLTIVTLVDFAYPPVSEKPLRTDAMKSGAAMDETAFRREIEVRDQQLEALLQERERERADKDKQIESLTRRLEAADDERRTTLRQLTAILTDQRAQTIIMPPPVPDRQQLHKLRLQDQ
jgi:hypothetical protein